MSQPQHNYIDAAERTYARALLELAQEAGSLDAIAQEALELVALIREQPDLRKLLDAKMISTAQRAGMLERLFKSRLHETFYRFLQIVNKRNHLVSLLPILRAFQLLVEETRGRIEVDAFVAQPLTPSQQERITAGVGASLQRTVILHEHVEPSLIGGVRLRVGDRLIDGSILTQLRILRERMIQTGRERARDEAQNAAGSA